MKAQDCRPRDEIFSHEGDDGDTLHINTTALSRLVMSGQIQPNTSEMDLFEEIVNYIESNHGVEQHHMEYAATRLEVPIMVIEFTDGKVLVVDGNHRLVARWRAGLRTVHGLIFKPDQWALCTVQDLHIPRELYVPQQGHNTLQANEAFRVAWDETVEIPKGI